MEVEKVKTSLRMSYEAQTEVIKKQIGDIDHVRARLGLSQRKMAQLLLVDPSTWTRWAQDKSKVPPSIYRSLQWFLALEDKIPGLNASYFLQKDTDDLKKNMDLKLSKMFTDFEEKMQLQNKIQNEDTLAVSINDRLVLEEELISLKSEVLKTKEELRNQRKMYLELKSKLKKLFFGISFLVLIFLFYFY